jgi:hypothetical protein
MISLKIVLIAIALISTAILALSIRIVLVKDGKFPETHISRNAEMKKKGILCVKSMDRMEQAKIEHKNRYQNVSVLK